jgi:hypothetical protein
MRRPPLNTKCPKWRFGSNFAIAVLTGTRKLLEGATFNRVWLETQKEMSGMSPNAKHLICDHCGHYVHKDDPGLVIDAIRDVMARAALLSDRK